MMKTSKQTEPNLIDWELDDSPYYTKDHKKFRIECREFVKKEVIPNIDKWSKMGDVPKEFYKKCYNSGFYSRIYPKELGGTPTNNDIRTALDLFYFFIWNDEFCQAGAAGLLGAVWIHGLVVTPILMHGNKYQRELIKDVITADKFAALCVSEPTAGSDVKNIKTTAVETEDGQGYVINGEKYWITGGMKADYFLTTCQTVNKNGVNEGLSIILVPRQEGLYTTRLALQGHDCSATAYVVYKNVKVSKKMVVIKKGKGFKATMKNFNNERMGIICMAVGLSKCCIKESTKYASKRMVFGKRLIDSQVIRHKLAEMTRKVLATKNYLENVLYRMKMKPFSVDKSLIKDVALLKVQSTKTLEYCAREASQIFGGRSYIRGGSAGKIERIYRDVRALAIYGGSEEIMLDLACKQAKL